MDATLSSTAVTRRQFAIRHAIVFIMVLIGGVALGAVVFHTYAGTATIIATAPNTTAEAYSARLLDQNNIFYPSETVSTAETSATSEAYSARLFDQNNIFYPSDSGVSRHDATMLGGQFK